MIKKTRSNYFNGENFETHHAETQAEQVKILGSNGNVESNIEESLIIGKLVSKVSLNTLKDNMKYRVKDCTNAPITMVAGREYVMRVETVGTRSTQFFNDTDSGNVYMRVINGSTVGKWNSSGQETDTIISGINKNIGALSSLKTTKKDSIVNAINEVKTLLDANKSGITSLESSFNSHVSKYNSHKHDSDYLKLTGGSIAGSISIAEYLNLNNNKALRGKSTSGANIDIAKVSTGNEVVIGHTSHRAVINASKHDAKITDGTTAHGILHKGIMGHGKGIDADTVDGVHASNLPKLNAINLFKAKQIVDDGYALAIRAKSAGTVSGSIRFEDHNGATTSIIMPLLDGGVTIKTGSVYHRMKNDGEFASTGNHVITGSTKQVRYQLRRSGDEGFSMFLSTNGNAGMYDHKKGRTIFSIDRTDSIPNMPNGIRINGRKLTLSSSAPSSPSTNDIWIS